MDTSSPSGSPLAGPQPNAWEDPAARAAQRERLGKLVEEWEVEHGPVPEEELQRIRDKAASWPE